MAPSCDLLDQNGCETFRPEFLMDTEEVDLGALDGFGLDAKCDRNSRYERYQLS